MELIKKGFCSSCGTKLRIPEESFPRECMSCGGQFWDNPLPVIATLVPVIEGGVLIGQRGHDPRAGDWNLLAGFIEKPHSWRVNGVREVREETNGCVIIEPESLILCDAYSPPESGDTLLLFAISAPISRAVIETFRPIPETLALKIVHEPAPLAFRSHTNALKRYFEGDFDHLIRKARPL